MREALERGAYEILDTLHKNGFEGYLVGGCVRDRQWNRPVKDYDIATSARPEQVERLFARTIPTGVQHGTVTVVIQGQPYEVTTFRKEEAYENHRRPTEVEYIDNLFEDLRRRDFTMNAMAMNREGKLIDPFGGAADMDRGILRCVGDAGERFQEDALRMLRCIRFAAEYALEIEAATWKALSRLAPLLQHIAMERVRMELERMIAGAAPNQAIGLLAASGILRHSKAPLRLAALDSSVSQRLVDTRELREPLRRWAYMYLQLGAGAAEAEEDMRRLTFAKQQIETVRLLLAAAAFVRECGDRQPDAGPDEGAPETRWKLAAVRYGRPSLEALRDILAVDGNALIAATADADGQDNRGPLAACTELWVQHGLLWLEEMPVDRVASLRLSGGELIAATGKPAGPWVAEVLNHLVKEAALGRVANEKQALLAEAEQYLSGS